MTGTRVEGGAGGLTLENIGEIVTLKEAAKATRLSEHVIRKAHLRGELPGFIPGGRDPRKPGAGMGYRFRRSDLQAWFFGATRGGTKA